MKYYLKCLDSNGMWIETGTVYRNKLQAYLDVTVRVQKYHEIYKEVTTVGFYHQCPSGRHNVFNTKGIQLDWDGREFKRLMKKNP